MLAQVQAKMREAGGGAGGGAAAGGGRKAECPRKGDGSGVGGDDDIGDVDCDNLGCPICGNGDDDDNDDDEDEDAHGANDMGGGSGTRADAAAAARAAKSKKGLLKSMSKRKGKSKRPLGYTTKGTGPPLTKDAGFLLSALVASIFSREKHTQLDAFLDSLGQPEDHIELSAGTDLPSVVSKLNALGTKKQIMSFWYMVNLVQLAMHVHSIREDCARKYLHVPGYDRFAREYGGSSPSTFQRRLESGTRLLSLCRASTPYILVIIAATSMQEDFISRSKSTDDDIIALCSALREVSLCIHPDEKWGPLINHLRVPLEYIRNQAKGLTNINFHYRVPNPSTAEVTRKVAFYSLIEMDEILEKLIGSSFAKLPRLSSAWYSPVGPWNIFQDPEDLLLPDVHTIVTPANFVKTSCPVTASTTDEFTREQRDIAEDADVAQDLEELEELIQIANQGPDGYQDGDRNALRIQDPTGKVLAELFTLPPELRQKLQDAIALVQAAMPGEWKDDTSQRENYKYGSFHYSWYARYGEKGHDAPKDAEHLNNVQRDHGGRVNFEQRIPHESKDIKEHPQEFAILADAYTDIFDYIRVVMQRRFRNEFDELSIYCDALPMKAACPSYPFGGFVLNLRVSTSAHRDHGDKKLCVVIPFGQFQGGQLCLYEIGLKFDLRLGDVLIFPSCDLTHFNMHFSGKRGTLVLHSDRQGDGWVSDRRGWSEYINS
ncbi:hypothetical protein B0H14DRAFT_3730063 [Mycena olivaceomarginata]|nr:hypothetical protein B0H14DRAFT_3730063 [Mycena olivaceomarginata]